MKKICIMFFYLISSAYAIDDNLLQKSYERELQFLKDQKKSLIETKSQLQVKLKQQKNIAGLEILAKKEALISLQQKNQKIQEELSQLEKYRKDGLNALSQLEKTSFRIYQNTNDLAQRLGLGESFVSLPNHKVSPIVTIENQLQQSLELLKSLSTPKWKSHAFLDAQEHLQKGEILFYGLFSAQGKIGDKIYLLAPYNQHWLKVLSASNQNQNSFYFFDSQFQKKTIKVVKTWKESIADLIPGIIMGLIMITVLGLFINLARS